MFEGEIALTDGTEEKTFTLKLYAKRRAELNKWVSDFQGIVVFVNWIDADLIGMAAHCRSLLRDALTRNTQAM